MKIRIRSFGIGEICVFENAFFGTKFIWATLNFPQYAQFLEQNTKGPRPFIQIRSRFYPDWFFRDKFLKYADRYYISAKIFG